MTFARRLTAEFLGTAALVTTTVSAGVMAAKSGASPALALLYVGVATGAVLGLLILTLRHISGAHFNPAVSLVMVVRKSLSPSEFVGYMIAQIAGGFVGVITANVMNGLHAIHVSAIDRSNGSILLGEVVATFGLVGIIVALIKLGKHDLLPIGVASWVCAGIMFTSSTCFANPAVTFARIFTSSGSGIDPTSTLYFVIVQCMSAVLAAVFADRIFEKESA
jgi:glycerol uptake facilitator-like aquaporin